MSLKLFGKFLASNPAYVTRVKKFNEPQLIPVLRQTV